MKKSLLIITLLVAVACLPATAQQLVKKRTSLSLVKKRAFGLPQIGRASCRERV